MEQVRQSAVSFGTKRTWPVDLNRSAYGSKSDVQMVGAIPPFPSPAWRCRIVCPAGKSMRIFADVASLDCSPFEKTHARKTQFAQAIQLDLGRPVPQAKTIRFLFASINGFLFAIPARQEGRTRRHGRWAGMRWTRERRARRGSRGELSRERSRRARRAMVSRTEKSCGPGVPTLALNFSDVVRSPTGP